MKGVSKSGAWREHLDRARVSNRFRDIAAVPVDWLDTSTTM